MRVLLADDSGVMRKLILRLLREVGVPSATEAADGAEAVALFKARPFDLVLTDWNMPNKSGLEVVREIRATGSSVPIVMITTEAEKERIADAVLAGASDYLVKPFDHAKLIAMLNVHVRAKSGDPSQGWCPQFVARSTSQSVWGRRIS